MLNWEGGGGGGLVGGKLGREGLWQKPPKRDFIYCPLPPPNCAWVLLISVEGQTRSIIEDVQVTNKVIGNRR